MGILIAVGKLNYRNLEPERKRAKRSNVVVTGRKSKAIT